MPPFRIPFTSRRPVVPNGVETASDENARPASHDSNVSSPYTERREKPSLALGIKERHDEPNEFKLSSVNDSGEYLPPSPVEKPTFWHKSPSTSSSNHRNLFNENEPFSISRESFESYRRSFDISGRSPILQTESFVSRTSLDSRTSRLLSRSTINSNTFERPEATEEEDFEDVKLNDDSTKAQPKRRNFFSRSGDSPEPTTNNPEAKSHHFHLLPGRKRGQSGVGSELGDIPRPSSKGNAEVTVR